MNELNLFQVIVLSLIQAFTEFLPISSSAHLLLPNKLFGWPDQGLFFDIVVHLATLLAVLIYFRHYFLKLDFYISKTFFLLVLATAPIVLIVLLFESLGSTRWTLMTIALANIFFAVILLIADKVSTQDKHIKKMSSFQALTIGFAQAFSIISGASRSGTAISAALILGFSRREAARFALMLSIPTILGAVLFSFLDYRLLAEDISILNTFSAFLVTFIASYFSISIFLKLINTLGYTPFVIYRVLLGVLLLCLI